MNRLVCLLAVVGAVSAQSWGFGGHRDESAYSGPRAPIIPAPLSHDGRVLDTADIVHAKAAHFAAHDKAIKALPPQKQFSNEYIHPEYYRQQEKSQQFRAQDYRGPQEFNNKVNEDYDNYNEERDSEYEQNAKEEPRWRGPYAKIEFTEDGKFIKDTPEVQHARQQHLAALAAAKKSPLYQPEPQQPRHVAEPNHDEGSYRADGEARQHNEGNSRQTNQYNPERGFQGGYDDGQYRAGQGPAHLKRWQGPGNNYQLAGRRQGYF